MRGVRLGENRCDLRGVCGAAGCVDREGVLSGPGKLMWNTDRTCSGAITCLQCNTQI